MKNMFAQASRFIWTIDKTALRCLHLADLNVNLYQTTELHQVVGCLGFSLIVSRKAPQIVSISHISWIAILTHNKMQEIKYFCQVSR